MPLLRLTAIDFTSQFQACAHETAAFKSPSPLLCSDRHSQKIHRPVYGLCSGQRTHHGRKLELEQETGGETAMKADEMRQREGKSQDFSYL